MRIHYVTIALLLALIATGTAAAQSPGSQILVQQVEANAFPEVSVHFRALDSHAHSLNSLTQSQLAVFENGQPVKDFVLSSSNDNPVHIVFVLDIGRYSNYGIFGVDRVRQIMRTFAEGGYFRDGIDNVTILAQHNPSGGNGNDQTTTLLASTRSSHSFLSAVDNLNFQAYTDASSTKGLQAVEQAILDLESESERVFSAVIYLGRLIDLPQGSQSRPLAQQLGSRARNHRIRIFSLHTEINNPAEFAQPLRALADESDGDYILLDHNGTNAAALSALYQKIDAERIRYTIAYRSTLGESGLRQVVVLPAGEPVSNAVSYGEYTVSLRNPTLTITSPQDNTTVSRIANRTDANTWNFDSATNRQAIVAELDWQASPARGIEQVDLLVDGVVASSLPNPEGTRFEFSLPLTDFTTAGLYSSTLAVRAIDEFGTATTSSPITMNVDVIVDKEVVEVVSVLTPCEENPSSTECLVDRTLKVAPWIVVAGLAVFFFIKRKQLLGVAAQVNEIATDVIRKSIVAFSRDRRKALARLQIVFGPEHLQGEEIAIISNRTTIGRDPKSTDVQLYGMGDSSSVSRKHCTIQFDGGRFLITNHSDNGTRVNGRFVEGNEVAVLQDNDEIRLGDVARQGAILKFKINSEVVNQATYPSGNTELMAAASGNTEVARYEPAAAEEIATGEETYPVKPVTFSVGAWKAPRKQSNGTDESWMDELEE